MIRAGRQSIIPLFAADVLGLGLPAIGWIVTIAAFVDMAMFYPAGVVMDRFGRKWAIVPSFFDSGDRHGAGGLGDRVHRAAGGDDGHRLWQWAWLRDDADVGVRPGPKKSMGEFLGVWRLVGDSGNTGAPIVVGMVADMWGCRWRRWSSMAAVRVLPADARSVPYAWICAERRRAQCSRVSAHRSPPYHAAGDYAV